MKRILSFIITVLSLVGCGTSQYVPIEYIEKIEYRDSLVYIKDTLTIEIPVEKIVQMVPQDTTSQIATSLAFSEAKVEKGILTHTLEQKGQIKAQIDTVFKVEYIDRIVEREIPVEVVKEVKHIPNWCWWSLIINVIGLCFLILKIYLKIR